MSDAKDLLTIEEFARRCSLGRTKVYELIDAGEIRAIRINRARRIPAEEIPAFIARKLEEAAHA